MTSQSNPPRDGRRPASAGEPHRNETDAQRWDRNFTDLLQELRVAQTGVQIMFAFLLTLPFSAQFGRISRFDKAVYLVALVGAACAAGLLIAPVAYHRALFRLGRKQDLVRSAHRLVIGGLVILGVAMVAGVLLVTDVVVGAPYSAVLAGLAALLYIGLWYVLPHTRRNEPRSSATAG